MSAGNVDIASIAQGRVDLSTPPTQPSGTSAKATHYVEALYDARCTGQWDSIAELARKVEKHAPKRRCLALAAKAGSRIFPSPSPDKFRLVEDEYGEHLTQAVRRGDSPPVDVLDASVCRASILLGLGRAQSALSILSEPLHRIAPTSKGTGMEGCVSINVLLGTLVRGLSLERLRKETEASNTYRSIIAYISHVIKLPSQCPELLRWTEELLCRICLFFATDNVAQTKHLGEAMASFHLLSQYLDGRTWRPLSSRSTFTGHSSRQVWRAYVETLSRLIRDDLVYHPSPAYRDHDTLDHRGLLDDDDFTASRIRQYSDLRRVQSNYETLLLKETKFPKANEKNTEVNSWVELVMSNWTILCGPTWTNQELGVGPGGKAVVARNTLDILYSAVNKTFHSTPILRHLFTVHTYLGDFDIAFKAFDSYVEIMNKGRSRAEKSGHVDPDLDDDETAIRLAADAIRIACRLGSEQGVEKAMNINDVLQTWMRKSKSEPDAKGVGEHQSTAQNSTVAPPISDLSPEVLSLAYRSMGLSQAQHARTTPLPASRAEMQQEAIANFRRSLEQGLDAAACVETLYALSTLLAETRDIENAIQTIRLALNNADGTTEVEHQNQVHSSSMAKEGQPTSDAELSKHVKLLPAWHLLAQLLCAREEFEMARSCCSLAMERLGGIPNLLQKPGAANVPHRTSVRDFSQSASNSSGRPENTVDTMDNLQKQVLLEMKMTQLALSEVMDGPETAVNGANELLALYSRLFGTIDFDSLRKSRSGALMGPPKSSSGTVRSIFGRSKSVKSTAPGTPAANSRLQSTTASGIQSKTASGVQSKTVSGLPSNTNSAWTSRPNTSTTEKPAIKVTKPTGGTTPPSQPPDQEKLHRPNVLRKKSSSIRREEGARGREHADQADEKHLGDELDSTPSNPARVSFQNEKPEQDDSKETNNAQSGARPLGNVAENLASNEKSSPSGHSQGQPPKQDTRLSVPYPHDRSIVGPPAVVELGEQRFKCSLLVKIWLFVARLYSKVSLFDDANEAVTEARKLTSGIESEVLKQSPSIRQLQDVGWGRAKSIEEMWADVFAEEGKLYQSRSLPHDALESFENALSHDPDHVEATVALCDILLDMYCQIIPPEKPDPTDLLETQTAALSSAATVSETANGHTQPNAPKRPRQANPEPSELARLASRDRAYGLLSSLTRLGAGWDNAEAWFVLARAYEESGQIDKAKEALWWTVHLEDTKPIRHWRNVNPGGYVL